MSIFVLIISNKIKNDVTVIITYSNANEFEFQINGKCMMNIDRERRFRLRHVYCDLNQN